MKITAANRINFIRVLRAIWLNEGISRIEIADLLGLDKSTISNITSSLQRSGVIIESDEGEVGPQGGRRPIKLKLNRNCCVAAGIEVKPSGCSIICINLSGEVVVSKDVTAGVAEGELPGIVSGIVEDLEKELESENIILAGAGLGLSGIINPEKGLVLQSIPLGISGEYPVADELLKFTDIPFLIDNDGNCCCWGELVFNRTEQLKDFIYCLLKSSSPAGRDANGLSIGIGIVIDGKVHYGRNFSAGEFRSVFVKEGSAEQISAGGGRNFINRFSDELGRNLSLLVNTFSLSECFIGGDLSADELEVLLRCCRKEFDNNWSYPGRSACGIRSSSLGDRAVAYGAASMVIDRLFRIPDFRDLNRPGLEILRRII